MDLTLHLIVHLKIAFGSRIEDATEGWSEGTPKSVLWYLYKDVKDTQ